MIGDSVKEAREMATELARTHQGLGLGIGTTLDVAELLRALADELEQAQRELGELSQTLLARDKALEASYHELTALRASLPAERRKAAHAAIDRTLEWAEELCMTLTASGSLSEWLNENYPEGGT